MQFVSPPSAALSLDTIFQSCKATATESKAIKSAREKIAAAWAIVESFTPQARAERLGKNSPSVAAMHKAAEAFRANPSTETAEAYHAAILRVDDVEKTCGSINADAQKAIDGYSQSLRPIAAAIGERAKAALETEATKHRDALLSAEGTFGPDDTIAIFDDRLAATRAAIAHELTEAQQDPLGWITGRELA
jgi:hypothetical protein